MNLRKFARGKPCMVRIPRVCNGDHDTTVLAHIRMPGITGVGLKAPDLLGAWCCSACHDVVDGRVKSEFLSSQVQLFLLQGVMRTQYELINQGLIP